ncbi:MAG: phosphoribosylformylglycinamidine synthase subunit PurQ [Verrucomicrobiota bacterium]
MRWAVVQFPGSNCDQDCLYLLKEVLKQEAYYVWHKDSDLKNADGIILPGGFSYGDYLRCGAIAKLSPVMKSVVEAANQGKIVIGICNGFQVLCESGLLPGALIRNKNLKFRCHTQLIRVENTKSRFTSKYESQAVLNLPIAHGEGSYFADPTTLKSLSQNKQILFRYCNEEGSITDASNPNGACENIAGICNAQGNVLGMMPHPERASESALGCVDGLGIFQSVIGAA